MSLTQSDQITGSQLAFCPTRLPLFQGLWFTGVEAFMVWLSMGGEERMAQTTLGAESTT
ncbi:hypothetical protein HCU01_19280 [Halomonas cupida]|uniref:Uncharacterized protein n=1 Tax=Halomonas cupida TaxID=44933 RepID=A0ABQ0WEC7_9GAMM|nr:hypothetical protein HCU01_19280 [Halomonas cupida]